MARDVCVQTTNKSAAAMMTLPFVPGARLWVESRNDRDIGKLYCAGNDKLTPQVTLLFSLCLSKLLLLLSYYCYCYILNIRH